MATAVYSTKVLVIGGTTAVGKTALSLELAKRLNGEIISADSVQVYRHMDIGSAKIDNQSMAGIPHHLINVADINDLFSAGEYVQQAKASIEDIVSRGKVPIVVGGTSLYLNFLINGTTGSPASTEETRLIVDKYIEEDNGDWEKSLARLKALDPVYADTLYPNDWKRLKRALDICLQSGRTVSSFKQRSNSQCHLDYDFKCLFLSMPRLLLFNRIDERCEQIINDGILKETALLVRHYGLKPNTVTGSSIGYRQSLEYLAQEWNYPHSQSSPASGDDGSSVLLSNETKKAFLEYLFDYQAKTSCFRSLARQQLVWFKKEPRFHWLNMWPQGESLSLPAVADGVETWFKDGVPLPSEWDGSCLQTLTDEEQRLLKSYTTKQYDRLKIYNKDEEIIKTLTDLKRTLSNT